MAPRSFALLTLAALGLALPPALPQPAVQVPAIPPPALPPPAMPGESWLDKHSNLLSGSVGAAAGMVLLAALLRCFCRWRCFEPSPPPPPLESTTDERNCNGSIISITIDSTQGSPPPPPPPLAVSSARYSSPSDRRSLIGTIRSTLQRYAMSSSASAATNEPSLSTSYSNSGDDADAPAGDDESSLAREAAPRVVAALEEVVKTERDYVAALRTLHEGYKPRLASLLDDAEMRAIFGNVESLLGVHACTRRSASPASSSPVLGLPWPGLRTRLSSPPPAGPPPQTARRHPQTSARERACACTRARACACACLMWHVHV